MKCALFHRLGYPSPQRPQFEGLFVHAAISRTFRRSKVRIPQVYLGKENIGLQIGLSQTTGKMRETILTAFWALGASVLEDCIRLPTPQVLQGTVVQQDDPKKRLVPVLTGNPEVILRS